MSGPRDAGGDEEALLPELASRRSLAPTILEDLTPGTRVRGVLPDVTVEVVQLTWHGTEAATLTYRDSDGRVGEQLLYRDDEARLLLEAPGPAFAFDGDGALFRLASEALRIRLAYLFDPLLAVHTSVIEPLPHQIEAVYDKLLPRQPLRFLLADDPGAGKTIMAGLYIKELIVRGDLKRALVICPGALVEQWQDDKVFLSVAGFYPTRRRDGSLSPRWRREPVIGRHAASSAPPQRRPVVESFAVERSAERWPEAAAALRDELAGRPGRLALVCGEGAERTTERIAEALGVAVTHVGKLLTAGQTPPTPSVVAELLSAATVLVDCEILFDPEVGVDPLQLLRALARRSPRIAVWPGRIASGRATYSEPGRRDHYESALSNTLVISPRHTAFPDEVPYTVERIP